ncbi:uncharacterized protein LOC121698965 isoform X1 [Alosa sapidissima]|uniref:uncharacterized protein LOC121698965 isoform X1 n=2 Tax=Alosa sapidissima TaxID=34773 RepID=UPI001C08BE3B|nr:uncharacterized protein LOC121698965 isoform X1 [Alosa sapidissima]
MIMGATVVEGEPHGGVPSYMPPSLEFSGLEGQTEAMIMDQNNPFKVLIDQKKVQGPNKEKYLLGMKVWLQTQMGMQRVGQHLPRLNGTVPLPEEAALTAAACPSVVDDGWTSFMFSMIHRMVTEENGRAELWATVLQFKEQALVQEAQAKLDLLSCQPRCGEEAGQGPLTESIRVTSQLMHQQAQMKKLIQATQAASEDRKMLLKHLDDLKTQRASTIQLQKQAEVYRKEAQMSESVVETSVLQPGQMQRTDLKVPEAKLVSPAASAPDQDTKVLYSEVQDTEDQTFEQDLSLKVAMGEHQEKVDKSSYENDKYEELSTKDLYDLLLAKQGELEEIFQKNGTLRTLSPKYEVASHDAAVMPDDTEDIDLQCKDDFESGEDEAETCSSLSSTDDCVEFLLTDSAVSAAEETPRVSARSDQQALGQLNREDKAAPSNTRAQDQASWSTKAGQAGSKVTIPTRQLQVQALDTPHHPGKVEMLVHHAVQEMWQSFELGQGPKDLSGVRTPRPSEQYLVMDTPGQATNTISRRSYNKLIFDLSWETLQDLCAKDPTTQPVWKQIQPERRNYVNKLKSFDGLSKVQHYITEEVFKLCGLQEGKDAGAYGKVFAHIFKGLNMEKYDQILIKDIPVEEHQWRDQDREAYDVKNKYAKVVFDHLIDDTLTCLLGLSKKKNKRS